MRARRVDLNHRGIVTDLQECGYSVIDLSGVGHGVPDILISGPSDMWLCEIKSAFGKLNPMQVRWHQSWRGKPAIVAKTFEEIWEKIKAP